MARVPPTGARTLLRVLRRRGFVQVRQRGSHLTLRHPDTRVTVTVPVHTGQDIGRGLLLRILKDARIDPADFAREA